MLYYRHLSNTTTVTVIPVLVVVSIFWLLLYATTTITVVHAMATTPKSIVVVGGGIQGTSVAYYLSQKAANNKNDVQQQITILEAVQPANAASGKGGGFMARSWGDNTPTQKLHELAFDLYDKQLSKELDLESYRKLPVLSVTPGYTGLKQAKKQYGTIIPNWLDGKSIGRISPLGYGDDTAQVTPKEVVDKMIEKGNSINVILGQCVGIDTDQGSERGSKKVTGVQYKVNDNTIQTIPADIVIVSAGPWSCQVEDWFAPLGITVKLPMEGVKSTSITWESQENVDATALFCGEDHKYGTHLEVYPRPDGTIYLCGIGGSDYITTEELKNNAFLQNCDANPTRVTAAMQSFRDMATTYENINLARQTACMRPCPPDAMPYMGQIHPKCEGVYINAGHNCWGIAWAPACGMAMAELVLDGECKCVNLSPFDPTRFTPKITTGRGRKKQGMDVGEQW